MRSKKIEERVKEIYKNKCEKKIICTKCSLE